MFAICLRSLALSHRSPLSVAPVGATSTAELDNFRSPTGSTIAEKARDSMNAPPIEITVLMPGFIDTRMTSLLRAEGSNMPSPFFRSADGIAKYVKRKVENGGTGIILWPWEQGVVTWAGQGELDSFLGEGIDAEQVILSIESDL